MCTPVVVTVALFSVLQLMCLYLFVCLSLYVCVCVCVCVCHNVHGLPVPASNCIFGGKASIDLICI